MDDLGGADGVEFWRAEARRWRAEATELAGYRGEAQRLTADNLVLRAQVADLQAQVDALVEKVSVPAKLAFGTSSEKASTRATASEDSATTPAGGLGAAPAGGQGKRGRGQRRAHLGMAAGTIPTCRPAKRSTTLPRPSGRVRAAVRATPRSGKSAASRSTGRSG